MNLFKEIVQTFKELPEIICKHLEKTAEGLRRRAESGFFTDEEKHYLEKGLEDSVGSSELYANCIDEFSEQNKGKDAQAPSINTYENCANVRSVHKENQE